jgi:putative heme-binding domain-containing protein
MELVLKTVQGMHETIQQECLRGLIDGISQGAQPSAESKDGWASLKSLLGGDSAELRMLATTLGARLGLTDSPELQAVLAEAAKHALEAHRPIDERQRAIQLLANAPYAILVPCATRLLDAQQPPALQQAAIEALGSSEDARVGAVLLAEWPGLTPKMRQAVLRTILARENRLPELLDAIQNKVVRAGDINAIQREQLVTSRNEEIAARARSLLESPAEGAELEQRIDRYQKGLAGPRNPQRGNQIFATFCLACHKLKEEGFQVGPPLGSVTNKPDEAILLDILDPSTHIESEFESYIVVTNQGRTFTGVLVSESATSVTLSMEKGMSQSILRTDIDLMKASGLSLMASNLHEQIGPQDAADLIAFLRGAFGSADSASRDGQK